MEVFDWLAPSQLEVDEVSLAVTGPWLALSLFLSTLGAPHGTLSLGVAGLDGFAWSESRAGAGRSATLFRAQCSMGLGTEALKILSVQWPTLAFAAAHRDPYVGVELHWFQTGSEWTGALDSHDEFSSMERRSWFTWNRIDERILALPINAQVGAAANEALLDAAPGRFGAGSLFRAHPEPFDVARMLAGFEPSDPLTWTALAKIEGATFRLAPAPWWPAPPGPWGSGSGAALLGSMATRSELSALDRCLAARRALSAAPSSCLGGEGPARVWLWEALSRSLLSSLGRTAWVQACYAARETECSHFGKTLHGARSPLSLWFDAQTLARLASCQPRNARALMVECGSHQWGYSLDELVMLSMAAPEVGALATAQALGAFTQAGAALGSGSTRL